MTEILKAIGPPGSAGFIALGLTIGVGLLCVWPRRVRPALTWIALLLVGHLLLALPVVSNLVADSLSSVRPTQAVVPARLLVVLEGNHAEGRARETSRASRLWPEAPVLVLGDDWFVHRLVRNGVPRSRIHQLSGPATTREQMESLRQYLSDHPAAPAAIVASRVHMRRVTALAATMGLQLLPLPAPLNSEPPRSGVAQWLPSDAALRLAGAALYEYAALAYYSSRGWIAAEPVRVGPDTDGPVRRGATTAAPIWRSATG
jgi:uncharacterized SAM-binding protein YcdF (DUF218 family)